MWSYSQLNSGQTTMVTWTFVTMNHSWMHSVTGLIRLAKDSWLWLIYRGQRKMMSSTWQTWPYTAPLGNLEVRIEELEALPSFSRLMFVIKSVSHWDLLNSRCDSSMNMFQYTSATILRLLNFPTAYSKYTLATTLLILHFIFVVEINDCGHYWQFIKDCKYLQFKFE